MSRKYYNDYDIDYETIIFISIVAFVFSIVYKVLEFIKLHWIISSITFTLVTIIIIYFILKQREKELDRLYAINTIEDMQKLNWREFEKFIEFVFNQNWFTASVRSWVKDWWIDVDAIKDWRKYFIQCKKWTNYKVNEPKIREFLWSLVNYDSDAKWIFITTSKLTKDAMIFADNNDIEIWDKNNLIKFVDLYLWKNNIENKKQNSDIDSLLLNEEKTIYCEKCNSIMIKREAKKWKNKWNFFYWCSNFPKCKNILNIEK